MPIKDSKIQSPLDDHYIALFEQSPFSMQIMSPEGLIIKVNKAWEELWGLTLDQLDGYNILKDEQLEKIGIMPYIKRAFDGQFTEIPPVLYDPNETLPNATRHAEPKRWTKAFIYPIKNSAGQVREVVLMLEDITAEKQAEEKTKANESRYHSLLENTSDIIYSHDLLGNYLSINNAGEKTTGYSLEELKKMNMAQLVAPEHLELAKQMIERKSHDHTSTFYELDIITKDGCRRTLEINPRVSLIEGESLAVEGVARDITERKRAEERLRESEAHLSAIFEKAEVGISEITTDGRFSRVNDELCRILGRPREEILTLSVADVTHAEDLWQSLAALQGLLETREPVSFDKRYVQADGTHVWANSTISLLAGSDNQPRTILAITTDLTARRKVEESLRESEERFRAMFEQANVGIVQATIDGQLIMSNPGFCKFIGYTEEEARRLNVRDITHKDDYEREVKLNRQFIMGEIPSFSIEKRYVRKDGNIIWGNLTTTLIHQASGEPSYTLRIIEDISEHKRIEEVLRGNEERLRLLIESASDYAIFTTTRDNLINTWNTGAERVFGWTESEALGQSGEIIFTPEDRKAGAPEQEIKTALEKGHAPDERFHIRKDGSRFYVSGMMTLLKTGDGKVQGFVKIARDISERLEAEKAVRDKEILQRIVGAQEDERKRIARDLHDELGQQLTALRLKLDSTRKMCKDEKLCDKIDEIQLIAKSVDNGVNFLAWEIRPPALDDLGLVAAIGNYVKQWSHHSGIAAELLASSLKKVRLAPEVEINFFRIVQEALNNTYKHAKAKNVEIILKKRDDLIVLIIEDNGKGFNPDVKKSRRKGIGLIGMKERAQLIGGTFEIESAPGQGTTVYVRIPTSLVKKTEEQ